MVIVSRNTRAWHAGDWIPPFTRPDGNVVTHDKEKVQPMAAHFSARMTVPDVKHKPPAIPAHTKATLGKLHITRQEVRKQLLIPWDGLT